ncbi:MAG: UDP-N-acetylmuramate--L-alanine ligase [Candidatus Sumerlaeota bacterium]|nr:UDP-N-acetylmuramate--L-alanine ligase [Candidatus Sumerlaeota bacterium]
MLPIKRIHFIGIGGVGMSAIAWVLLKKGIPVSGSDVQPNSLTARLEQIGAKIRFGHSPDNVKDAGLVVISSAIREDNPELVHARSLKIPIWHRSRMLADILAEGDGITIAGTHGKTTTTSMVSLMLEKAGLDPTILIGGDLPELGGNAKLGGGKYIVAEADESDGTFLLYHPRYTIITNVEPDHLDYYRMPENVRKAFQKFLLGLPADGYAILCADDIGLRSILNINLSCNAVFYSTRFINADFYAGDITLSPGGSNFILYKQKEAMGEMYLSIPGHHNIQNALAAVALGHTLGVPLNIIKDALEGFHGVKRRFQVKGIYEGVTVIDDYAHHPTEVSATLASAIALRESKKGRIIVVFQPHRYTRTQDFHAQFAQSFDTADIVVITEVYSAGEKPISGVSGKLIYDGLVKRSHPNVLYVPDMDDICDKLLSIIVPGDIVFTMGAGNISKVGERLLQRLTLKQPV